MPNTETSDSKPPAARSYRAIIVRVVIYAIIAFLVVIPIRLFIARPFIVSGISMEPAFGANEYLVIDELSYRYNKPQRGDVVVFRYPLDSSVFFIKRIVGMPGEVVRIEGGVVSISAPDKTGAQILVEPYRSHGTINKDSSIMLASDEYFVLGDNRDESADSRTWGPLQSRLIIGRPLYRLFPFSKMQWYPGWYQFPEQP